MAETTGISWCRSTWNPWIGCTEVSPGCDHCYARELDKRHRWGGALHWGAGVPRMRTAASTWKQPLTWNRKAAASGERWTVFPSLCDPFDNEVPEEWRNDFWHLIHTTPALTWLLLTKRIGNAAKMIPWSEHAWPNVWIGSSVVNQEEADRDIPKLLAVPAAKRFLSLEPMLEPIYISPTRGISWAIVGGESNQGKFKARPFDLAWARSVRDQCKAAGVPCFIKQDSGKSGAQGRFTDEEWAIKEFPT